MQTSGATKFNAAGPADLIDAAMENAIDDSLREGPWSGELVHQLAKHGLVIVDAAKYDRMLIALQLIGSCVREIDGIPTALEAMAQAARNALPKGA